MVAAAPLRDVVKQTAEICDLGLLKCLHDIAAVRKLLVKAGERKAPQITDDEQRVFVDGVSVEQVILHAADDAPERRDIEPQHAIEIHAPQFVRHSCRCA